MDVIGKRACPLVIERLDGRGHVRCRHGQCACRLGGKVILEPIMAVSVDAHRLLDQSAGVGKVAGDRVLAVDESLWRRGLAPQVSGRLQHVADEIGAWPQRHQRGLVVDRVAERHGLGEEIAEAGEQVHPGEDLSAGRSRRRGAVEGQPAVLRADECRFVIVDAHGRGDGGAVHGVEARQGGHRQAQRRFLGRVGGDCMPACRRLARRDAHAHGGGDDRQRLPQVGRLTEQLEEPPVQGGGGLRPVELEARPVDPDHALPERPLVAVNGEDVQGGSQVTRQRRRGVPSPAARCFCRRS